MQITQRKWVMAFKHNEVLFYIITKL